MLDKDWGKKVPDYITKGTFSLAVFFMSLTMRGEWIMFLAHYWRSQETDSLPGMRELTFTFPVKSPCSRSSP